MKYYRKVLVLLLAIAGASAPAVAQSMPARVWHWAGHHKEVLLADVIDAGSWYADATISMRCQHEFPTACIEGNHLIGPHPSDGTFLRYTTLYAGGLVTANHLTWHFAHGYYKHLIWVWTIPTGISEGDAVNSNANYIEWLEAVSQPTCTIYVTAGTGGVEQPVLSLCSFARHGPAGLSRFPRTP